MKLKRFAEFAEHRARYRERRVCSRCDLCPRRRSYANSANLIRLDVSEQPSSASAGSSTSPEFSARGYPPGEAIRRGAMPTRSPTEAPADVMIVYYPAAAII